LREEAIEGRPFVEGRRRLLFLTHKTHRRRPFVERCCWEGGDR